MFLTAHELDLIRLQARRCDGGDVPAWLSVGDQPMTYVQMAKALGQLSSPTTQEDADVSVDPDNYPLF